jgi:hypothetical protein
MHPIPKRLTCSFPLRLARITWALALALLVPLPAQAAPLQADPVWQIQIVDSEGDVGRYPALALDSRGYPVISYYDTTNAEIKLVRCGSPDCSTGNSIQTVDSSTASRRSNISMVLDSNDHPVISYADSHAHILGDNLKLARCGSPDCASGNSIQIVDSGDWIGRFNSLALDSRGYPVISYSDQDTGVGYLKLARCGSPDCASGNSILALGEDEKYLETGYYNSLALDSNDHPVISYAFVTIAPALRRCSSPDCSTGSSFQLMALGWSLDTSLALDSNDNPVISYLFDAPHELKLVRCGNLDCSAGNYSAQLVDSSATGFSSISLALDSNDNPAISYYDDSNKKLKLVRCGSPDCATGNDIQIVDSAGDGNWTSLSLALDSNDNPVISYYDAINNDLKLARLVTGEVVDSCGGYEVRQVDSGYVALGWHGTLQVGTKGNNTLIGTPGNDLLLGLGGNDKLDGKEGDDVLCGGDGVDQLLGGDGDDYLDGGAGNDGSTAGQATTTSCWPVRATTPCSMAMAWPRPTVAPATMALPSPCATAGPIPKARAASPN